MEGGKAGIDASMDAVALLMAECGAWVLPRTPGSKRPKLKRDEASDDLAKAQEWHARGDAFVLDLGRSGLVVVDCDLDKATEAEEAKVKRILATLDDTATWSTDTPSGGRHYVFRVPRAGYAASSKKLWKSLGMESPWIELKGTRATCNVYEPKSTAQMPKPMPGWLEDWVGGGALQLPRMSPQEEQDALKSAAAYVQAAVEGDRNNRLYAAALRLSQSGVAIQQAVHALMAASPLDASEVRETVSSAYSASELLRRKGSFAASFSDTALYAYLPPEGAETSPGKGRKWLRFSHRDGWSRERGIDVQAKLMAHITAATDDGVGDQGVSRQASSSMSVLASMCVQQPSMWDRNPWLLGLRSGRVADLGAGKLLEPSPAVLVSKRAGADAGGSVEAWKECLARWTCGDEELEGFLQLLAGYFLVGGNPFHWWVHFWGPGTNGKSTFLEMVALAMGDYALPNMSPLTFLKSGQGRHPAELAQIEGKRLVVVSDMPGKGWDFAKIKSLTGAGSVDARGMGQDPRQIPVECTFAGQSNPLPEGVQGAAWRRRMVVVPFEARIQRTDTALRERLQQELDGILGWMVDGAIAAKDGAGGMHVPLAERVRRKTEQVFGLTEEPLQLFVDECLVASAGTDTPLRDVAKAWDSWCLARGDRQAHDPRTTARRMGALIASLSPEATGANGLRRPVEVRKATLPGQGSLNCVAGLSVAQASVPGPKFPGL